MSHRQLVFRQPGLVDLESVSSDPVVASHSEVVVKNRFSLVSAGTELACLSGMESWFVLPGTPGYIAVGEVLAKGSAVTQAAEGDLVFTYGPHASLFKIDVTNRWGGMCIRVPATLRPDFAPFTRMASIAMTSVRVSHIEVGDSVLVMGLGLVGNLAAQLAGLQGANVIAADVSARRRETALACGIAHVVDSDSPGWKDQVRDLAGRNGVTTLIDATGLSTVIEDASSVLANNGEAILLGSPRAPHPTDLTAFLRRTHLPPFVEWKGALEWRFPSYRDEFVKHSVERNSEIIMALLASGRLRIEPLYTHRLPPSKAPEAYAGLRDHKDDYVGVVFDWTE